MIQPTVLITGCGSGIGKALVHEFLRQNHQVIATGLSNLIFDKHKNLSIAKLDVQSRSDMKLLAQQLKEKNQSIDYIINNAGYGLMGPILELDKTQLQHQFDTNVWGCVEVIQEFLPFLLESKRSKIVNIASISGIMSTPFSGAYCASKAALLSISDALRIELKPFDIEVISVLPGAIKSSFGEKAEKQTQELIGQESIYLPYRSAINKRAAMSQEGAINASLFAKQLVNALQSKSINPILKIGPKSTLMPFLKKWLPTKVLDVILAKKFSLNQRHSS